MFIIFVIPEKEFFISFDFQTLKQKNQPHIILWNFQNPTSVFKYSVSRSNTPSCRVKLAESMRYLFMLLSSRISIRRRRRRCNRYTCALLLFYHAHKFRCTQCLDVALCVALSYEGHLPICLMQIANWRWATASECNKLAAAAAVSLWNPVILRYDFTESLRHLYLCFIPYPRETSTPVFLASAWAKRARAARWPSFYWPVSLSPSQSPPIFDFFFFV